MLLESLVGAALMASWVARHRRRPSLSPWLLVPGVLLGATAATGSLVVTTANLNVGTWREARGPGAGVMVALLGAPLLLAGGALIAARWHRHLGGNKTRRVGPAPSLGLHGAQRALWVGTARSRWALPVALGALGAGTLAGLSGNWLLGALLWVVALGSVELTSVRALASASGVSVTYGPLRWPRQHIALDQITGAESTEVSPVSWGYRGSLRLFGRAAVILRGGEALRLDLVGHRSFLLTVDDAAIAAALINDEIGRAGGT